MNKIQHTINGNRNISTKVAWWNDKIAAKETFRKNRNKLAQIISRRKIQILGLSEANIEKEDPAGSRDIKGYDLIPDKMLNSSGKARAAILIQNNLRYKVRSDLMNEDTPEVWVEVISRGKNSKNLLVGQYYREFMKVRGN